MAIALLAFVTSYISVGLSVKEYVSAKRERIDYLSSDFRKRMPRENGRRQTVQGTT